MSTHLLGCGLKKSPSKFVRQQKPSQFDHLITVNLNLSQRHFGRQKPPVLPPVDGGEADPDLPCQILLAKVELNTHFLD